MISKIMFVTLDENKQINKQSLSLVTYPSDLTLFYHVLTRSVLDSDVAKIANAALVALWKSIRFILSGRQ